MPKQVAERDTVVRIHRLDSYDQLTDKKTEGENNGN
jgi:hypothetical protein